MRAFFVVSSAGAQHGSELGPDKLQARRWREKGAQREKAGSVSAVRGVRNRSFKNETTREPTKHVCICGTVVWPFDVLHEGESDYSFIFQR